MVDRLVLEFQLAEERLATLFDQYDTAEYTDVDNRISAVFEAIQKYEPSNKDELVSIVRFYLDLLERNDSGDNRGVIKCLRSTLIAGIERLINSEK